MMNRLNYLAVMAIVSVIIVSLTGIPAWAEPESNKKPKSYHNYARIGIGGSLFTDDLEEAEFEGGVNGSLSYGRYLFKYLVVEASIGGFATGEEFEGSTTLAGDYTRTDSILVHTLLATVKGEFPIGPVRLFAGGGVGGYFLTLHADMETDRLGDFESSQSDSVVGVHGVAGAYIDITQRFFLGLEGMYYQTDDIEIDERAASIPVSYNGNLDGFTVAMTCGFKF
jgi:opacity protein-like surface antigen